MDREDAKPEAVRRLVDHFGPEQIYLFGSSARKEDQAESVDVIPFRRSTFEARRDWLMSLPAIVARGGRLVYDARPKAA